MPDPDQPQPDDWDDRPQVDSCAFVDPKFSTIFRCRMGACAYGIQVMLPNYDTGEMELGDNPDYQGSQFF